MTTKSSAGWRALRGRRAWNGLRGAAKVIAVGIGVALTTGCSTLTQPIDGIPSHRLPSQFFPETKNDMVPIDIALMTIEPPREYEIGPGDILGIYVEGVLPFNPPNAPPEPPPVNFPGEESLLPPSIGFPIPVQDDGTLSLPLLEPLQVDGFTLDQVREAIREAYIDQDILREDRARPIVTIIRERTYDVIVVREDAGGVGARGGGTIRTEDQSAAGSLVKLPAYQNDILHALVETGGLPGLNAKNQVKVLRASDADKRKRADFIRKWQKHRDAVMLDPCACPPRLPDDPSIIQIPLRVKPGAVPDIDPDDVVLQSGDVVYIESRDTEVFYTGGLLPGGEHVLPRDYDLDVLGAMALAGGNLSGQGGAQGRGLGGGRMGGLAGGVPPGMLYVLRKTECDGQVAIEVDLANAINNPRSRPLVQPGDILLLRYKPEEELINAGVGTFFTFGIAELLRN